MKNKTLALLVFSLLPASFAQAQTDAAATAPVVDDTVQIGDDIRPEMPPLFYTGNQRRVLEAVRQDVISEETFDEESFVPLVLQQEQIDLTPQRQNREDTITVDSYIINRSTGAGVWWSGNEEREFSKEAVEGEEVDELESEGIVQFAPSREGDGSIVGVDTFNETRFVIKVGQQLAVDGEVSETYPVVIRKNEKE